MKEVVWIEPDTLFEHDFVAIRTKMAEYAAQVACLQGFLTPDLLKKEYRYANSLNPMYGHCYVASEVLWHINDRKLDVYHGRDKWDVVHWWLWDSADSVRIDATADQYYSVDRLPPYNVGRRSSFLTNEPSKRALIVIDRVYANENI